ncbi:MAG: cyclophilin-like fold protein [Planctomycetota bacterium]
MTVDITIEIGAESLRGQIDPGLAPSTVDQILDIFPISASTRSWGEEIYFPIPVKCELENAVETVNVGDLAYWPQGHAFCIFYGKTPMSQTREEIIPASPVTPIGSADGVEILRDHGEAEKVTVKRR